MPQDGVLLHGMTRELDALLVGARIDKVLQPERDELHLLLRGAGENLRLLLSASSNHARIHITQKAKPNPIEPPVFCMLLRKHLCGGRVLKVQQEGLDRILDVMIENRDELGEPAVFTLTIEIMGRHSNIIVHREGRIIDSIKRIPLSLSRVREVLPGLPYERPPAQDKKNPLELLGEEAYFALLEQAGEGQSVDRAICSLLSGVATASAQDIARRADVSGLVMQDLGTHARVRLAREMDAWFTRVRMGDFAPTLVLDDIQSPVDILPFPFAVYSPERMHAQPSLSRAMYAFYEGRDRKERSRQRSQTLNRVLSQALSRAENKLAVQRQALQDAGEMETLRLQGELLTANLYRVQKGMRTIEVDNYYTPGETLAIPLDIRKNPSENAQAFFKRYAKMRAALARATEELPHTQQEIEYLQGQLDNLEKCTTEAELVEIREELVQEGILRPEKGKKKKQPKLPPPSKPLKVMLPGGIAAYIGKNNQQNDRLTLRDAAPDDVWLHVKDAPGSHVIIKDSNPAQEALLAAAMLAAHYSSQKDSSNVAVDYTQRRYVKKPSGAKPGMVIYTHQRTLYVTPDAALLAKLEQQQ